MAVPILEPALGLFDLETFETRAIAFRYAIPNNYDPGNPVTMRFFFYRTGPVHPTNCFVFQLDGRRLQHGMDIEVYGSADPALSDSRWIRPDFSAAAAAAGGLFLVIDLPVNAPGGLNFTNDLAPGQLLAFELNTHSHDNGLYELLGVEVFESESALTAGATIFYEEGDIECPPK